MCRRLLILVLGCLMQPLFGQVKLSGTVQSQSDGSELPGVSIYLKAHPQIGTTTDENGAYNLDVPDTEGVLVFRFIGFKTLEVPIQGKSTLAVKLEEESATLNDVVVVGSRNKARTALETTVPVDVLDIKDLTANSPQVSIGQIMNYAAPSFSSNTHAVTDGTDHVDPASLRGLGPDQVLVLINGKRRHTSSLVNLNTSFGRGNVGTDLNAIPAAAIKRIEVLRDGAAAQYGSDAIAGVINIVLKDSYGKLNSSFTSGAYATDFEDPYCKDCTKNGFRVDGVNYNLNLNYGIKLNDKGGFVNLTGEFSSRDYTNRMADFEGKIFSAYNAIERLASKNGTDLIGLQSDLSSIKKYAQQVSYFDTALKKKIAASTVIDSTFQALLSQDVTDDELKVRKLHRYDFNMRVGQSQLRDGKVFFNAKFPLDEHTALYAFGGASYRNGESAGFYRLPYQARNVTAIYPNGFLPLINTNIKDQSLAVGIRGMANHWKIDFSNTWGENSFMYEINNTLNASLLTRTKIDYNSGGFSFMQNTSNLDLDRNWADVFEGLNLAFGLEYRLENYQIIAGEEGSWAQYDTEGNRYIAAADQKLRKDFFGSNRPGGAQVFPGFRPKNALSKYRNSVAGYADLEVDFTKRLLLTGAIRLEDYSDFGSTLNGKLAGRYKLSDNWSVRAAANTGFRAPSLLQLYYNSVSTVAVGRGIAQTATYSNDSRAAELLGIPQLKQETSKSVSLGFTGRIPAWNLKLTLDGYFTRIDNRVTLSGFFSRPKGNNLSKPQQELQKLFDLAGANKANFFANAINTESRGVELVLTQRAQLGNATLRSDLAATFSKTQQVGEIKASKPLADAGFTSTYFDAENKIYLEGVIPRVKFNLSHTLAWKNWNIMLRNVFFGSVTNANNEPDQQQVYDPRVITDLTLGYQLSSGLRLTLGANNLLDIYPEANNALNRLEGRFVYSWTAPQCGISGRYVFGRLSLKL